MTAEYLGIASSGFRPCHPGLTNRRAVAGDRFTDNSNVWPTPWVLIPMNLSPRPGFSKLSISGVQWRRDDSLLIHAD